MSFKRKRERHREEKACEEGETHRERCPVVTEAGTGVLCLQAKECLGLVEAGKDKADLSLEPLGRA